MTTLRTVLQIAAVTILVGTAQAAPVTFDFTKGPGNLVQKPNGTFLNLNTSSANFLDNSSTYQLTAKAYYIPDGGANANTFRSSGATLYQQRSSLFGSGLGICNNIENIGGGGLCSLLNGGAIDNQPSTSLEAEVLLLDLGSHPGWNLQDVTLGAFDSGDAYEIHARNYVSGSCATNFNLPAATPSVTATGGSSTVNLSAFANANCLYITGNFAGNNDDFFVSALNGVTATVPLATAPEPGTLALLGMSCTGLALARRRRNA